MTKKPSFLLLFLLISFGSVTAVLFTPALPEIQNYFNVSENQTQLTITLFLVGYALGQLLYGPLANGLGRIKALTIGVIVEIIACFLCVVSGWLHAFWLLVGARLLMAFGASAGLKMTFTLIADCYEDQESRRLISHLMMAFAITPGLGIALGGLLTTYFGWQSCFIALGLYGLFVLSLVLNTSETAKIIDKRSLNLGIILKKYHQKFCSLPLWMGGFFMGIGGACIYIFASIAPFISDKYLHLNASEYGLWNLLPPIGIIIGSQLSAHFSEKFTHVKAIAIGLSIALLGSLLMLLSFVLQQWQGIFLFSPLMVVYIGISFIFGNASTLAMQSDEDKSSASAVMNFVNIGLSTFSVFILSSLSIHNPLILPVSFVLLTCLGFLLLLKIRK